MNILDTNYTPNVLEAHWRNEWASHDCYAPTESENAFCMVLPPPNVTGTLHMGHGFQQTIMDIIIRYQRMSQKQTLWQGGSDHAGIATQMVVERQLAAQNTSRHDLGRDAFIDKVWEWKQTSGSRISKQIEELGASIDTSRDRFTMDEGMVDATQTAFCQLYEEGLIYRGKRLVNWDTKLQTAISDLEVINEEKQGHMWYVRYPLVNDPNTFLEVATTRPETMLGDVAVAVNPKDERYSHLIGQYLNLPITNRHIPIIADDYVDSTFGTGCVKITPAHDFNDYDIGKRHSLEPICIFDLTGHCNEHTPADYQGLHSTRARKQIIKQLETQGLLAKVTEHTLQVPMGDRSGTVIEPMLTDQWFINMKPLAEPALAALDNGSFHFIPSNWGNTYRQWLTDIQDWCISRQLWWGHQIPAYYDKDGNVYVGKTEAEVRKQHQLDKSIELTQDEDVLDTWFTSALWPFATLGWPHKTAELTTYYPTQCLVTGFDIIFFWVARMVMFGLKFMGDVPFKEVYMHGLIRDSHGHKMSKSKGNVLDPLDLIHGIDLESLVQKRTQGMMQPQKAAAIEKQTRKEFAGGINGYGTDALRFTFCALANTSRNINFDIKRIEGYRNFCNKLYNAARFVLQNTAQITPQTKQPSELNAIDQWIMSQLHDTCQLAAKHIADYRFDLLAQTIYEFVWNTYCDWYLELSKCILYNDAESSSSKCSTQLTLLYVLESICRLMHPITPFITETLWQNLKNHLTLTSDFISSAPYPLSSDYPQNQSINEDFTWIKTFISECRALRAQLQVKPSKTMRIFIRDFTKNDQTRTQTYANYIQTLANIEKIEFIKKDIEIENCASCYVGQMEILVPLAGLIDQKAELERIEKSIEKCQKEIDKSEAKLNNSNYTEKAPADVVQKERDQLANHQQLMQKLCAQKQKIAQLI